MAVFTFQTFCEQFPVDSRLAIHHQGDHGPIEKAEIYTVLELRDNKAYLVSDRGNHYCLSFGMYGVELEAEPL